MSGSRDVNFTMDLVLKDIGLFQKIADGLDIPLEISPQIISIIQDGQVALVIGHNQTGPPTGWNRQRV